MKFFSYILLFFCIQLASCDKTLSILETEKYIWQYQKGYYVGDYLNFDEKGIFKIETDSIIYMRNKKVAILKSCSETKLTISSVDDNPKIGYYIFFSKK